MQTIFNLPTIYENCCVTCDNTWCNYTNNWFLNIPLTGTSAHYWCCSENGVFSSAIIEQTPNELIQQTYQSLLTTIIKKILQSQNNNNNNANVKIEIINNTFVNISNQTKYACWISYLNKIHNGYQWEAMTVPDLVHKMNIINYCRQRKYSIVIQTLKSNNQNTQCNNQTDFGFESQVYQINHINNTIEIIPKKYPCLTFKLTNKQTQIQATIITENEKKNIENENEINQNIENIKPLTNEPPGCTTIDLQKHIQNVMNNGFITNKNCSKCKKIQNIVVKPQIFKLPMIWLIYLDQGESAMLQIDWSYQNETIEIYTHSHHKQHFQINAFIAQHSETKFTSHWRKNAQWYKLDGTQVTKYEQSTDHGKACLLFVFNYAVEA